MSAKRFGFYLLAMAILSACGEGGNEAQESRDGQPMEAAGGVSESRLMQAAGDVENWLAHGRTHDEQRFSPARKINDGNIGSLGLAWYFDIPTKRGIEATPLVIDGVMYVTGAWSIVYALDARSGKPLWIYDPAVPKLWAKYACCDVVNRGVAAWGNNVYVGTLDGYLVALDARSGEVVWRTDTIDRDKPYTITGAPRVVKGKVLIGNGGGEYGVRGYVTAYDAETGEQAWRFYTVPGNPADGFENDAMRMAAATWTGEWWKYGGGGTVWDSMAFDPELDLLYVGVGNGSPWDRRVRSPDGGDNLFISSIVALRPDTGEYVWHYQTTPGDQWDYTATQHMILADLVIDGRPRKVLMQAPKNGFFYVLDRASGELISAEQYTRVNWASGVDPQSGRPIEAPDARYTEGPRTAFPSVLGGHNWHPMAFHPATGLVYLSEQQAPHTYAQKDDFEFVEGVWNTGTDTRLADMPEEPLGILQVASNMQGSLLAWDPVRQREAWRFQQIGPGNGGVLATAGNLVFQGNMQGELAAYSADRGDKLWAFQTQTGITAAPITFELDGEQYVSVAVGWGTIVGLLGGPTQEPLGLENRSRVLTFKLGGTAVLPEPIASRHLSPPEPPEQMATEQLVERGHALYAERCMVCHGVGAISGNVLPDLRYSGKGVFDRWDQVVIDGALENIGMPGFEGVMSVEDSQAIKAYVIDRAQAAARP
ncbi:MAG TPA: PQQ-dependent dehydrogenase, methanol/ethanol family [Woeseiaceae bacterium]